MANETSGHESEFINVQDLKAALQKFKTDKVDVKVDKVTGKGLSTNDFTTAEKTKLSNAVTGPASSTDAHVAVFDGATGKIVKDTGFTIAKSVPSNAVFTDTTYSSEAAASGGTAVSLCTTGEKYTWNNKLSANSFTNNNKGTSVEKIMVADASNGLGYSTPSDLASVLGVERAELPPYDTLAIKVAEINITMTYRRLGFMFAIEGMGTLAMGIFSLYISSDRNSPIISIVKNVAVNESCTFIVVRNYTNNFSIYVTGTFPNASGGYILILPIDQYTEISIGNEESVSSLTIYAQEKL